MNLKSITEINFKELTNDKSFYPSPATWAKEVLYFLLVDRFSDGNLGTPYNAETDYENALKDDHQKEQWENYRSRWNGGNLKGLIQQLDYLKDLGVTALWVSPVLKQVVFQESYHGYGTQNFLQIDPHFGTNEEFKDFVQAAHEKGLYVVMDVIINHTGNVFEYEDPEVSYSKEKHPIKGFLDAKGDPSIPINDIDYDKLSIDDGVWPKEVMTPDAFSSRGPITDWDQPEIYIEGDFLSLKNIHTGEGITEDFAPSKAFKAVVTCFKYWIAYADLDGFRLDTVKHVYPGATRYFVQEIQEFAHSIGKHNFYIIGEVTGGHELAVDLLTATGLNAVLGINRVSDTLENVARGNQDPSDYFNNFKNTTLPETNFYQWSREHIITFFNDHDMVSQPGTKSRFAANLETKDLLANACFLNLLTLGIPCIYYGTEQGFDGKGDEDHYIREAMFGGHYGAFRTCDRHFFNTEHPMYKNVRQINAIRKTYPALSLGRQYLREVAYENYEFVWPQKIGSGRYTGVVAWSRILSNDEFVLAMNCHLDQDQEVAIIIDQYLHENIEAFECIYATDPSLIGKSLTIETDSDRYCVRVKVPAKGHVILKPIQAKEVR